MDEDGIGLVLARASELRSKITICIQNPQVSAQEKGGPIQENGSNQENGPNQENGENKRDFFEEEDEEAEMLLDIRDALKSLEAQLSSLQALQQQQWYEREAALAEIDDSREKLLKKLREYKGADLEVIREATAFASETVEEKSDLLLLPPYSIRPTRSLLSNNGQLSHLASNRPSHNGTANVYPKNELKGDLYKSESRGLFSGMGLFLKTVAKAVVTVAGVVAVLNLAGFEPKIGKRGNEFKFLDGFQLLGNEDKREMVECPPGKILVIENGETRCLVKERMEVPFESVISTPDVNFGCG